MVPVNILQAKNGPSQSCIRVEWKCHRKTLSSLKCSPRHTAALTKMLALLRAPPRLPKTIRANATTSAMECGESLSHWLSNKSSRRVKAIPTRSVSKGSLAHALMLRVTKIHAKRSGMSRHRLPFIRYVPFYPECWHRSVTLCENRRYDIRSTPLRARLLSQTNHDALL